MIISNTKIKLVSTLLLILIFCSTVTAQMRQVYVDKFKDNERIHGISFYSESEGYVAFNNSIGFTIDTGTTFIEKRFSNINYNGYLINPILGFLTSGIKAFSKDFLIVYGDFGWVPGILMSTDGGNSFKVVYYSQFDPFSLTTGITDMVFPENNNIGYAIDADRILKTTDRGFTWTVIATYPNSCFDRIEAKDNNRLLAISDYYTGDIPFPAGRTFRNNKIFETNNGGGSWQSLKIPPGSVRSVSLIGNNIYLNTDEKIWNTSDGGLSWKQQNKENIHPATFDKMKFINDSTGYSLGGSVYRTSDYGRIWESIPSNNFDPTYVGFQTLHFWNNNQFWAGGYKYAFLALTTNGGGSVIPKASFDEDLSLLESINTVKLINNSKKGYIYHWYKNGTLISVEYDASYITKRLSIDTIKLIVVNGNYSDTIEKVIDTRVNQARCYAGFTLSNPNAAILSYKALDSSYGTKNYWDFGDGNVDSAHSQFSHTFSAIGNYTITHKVYNTVSRCTDSTSKVITIERLENCLKLDFNYVADSFYTNNLTFNLSYDTKSESTPQPFESLTWDFGDGKQLTRFSKNPSHIFDSSGYFNVCVTAENRFTACKTTYCKPIFVDMKTTCDASFQIKQDSYTTSPVSFIGKPNASNKSKRNTWIFDNRDTVVTRDTNAVSHFYFTNEFTVHADGWNETYPSNSQCYNIASINIDSLVRTVKHIQYDSISHCLDSVTYQFKLNTKVKDPNIEVIQDSIFPNHFTYNFYQTNIRGGKQQYGSRWNIDGFFAGGYGKDYSTQAVYKNRGYKYIAIASPNASCVGNSYYREVYYKLHQVNNIDTCQIYPPKFSANTDEINPFIVNFYDSSWSYNRGSTSSNLISKCYFGDGDSVKNNLRSFSHKYAKPGNYNVTLTYYSPNGCSKTYATKVVINKVDSCLIYPPYLTTEKEQNNSLQINFYDSSWRQNQAYISYGLTSKCFFGDGDSIVNPKSTFSHIYKNPGIYTIRFIYYVSSKCTKTLTTTVLVNSETPPVTFTDFSGVCTDRGALLRWQTVTENNIDYFEIEKNENGINTWNKIASLKALENSTSIKRYQFLDVDNNGLISYRIKQLDKDGKSTISTMLALDCEVKKTPILVYPLPAKDVLNIVLLAQKSGQATIEVLDAAGIVLSRSIINVLRGTNKTSIDISGLRSGYYIIRVQYGGVVEVKKFLIE